jgi:hypothetical protein
MAAAVLVLVFVVLFALARRRARSNRRVADRLSVTVVSSPLGDRTPGRVADRFGGKAVRP